MLIASALSISAALALVGTALRKRGRPFARFAAILLGIHTTFSLVMLGSLLPAVPVPAAAGLLLFAYLQTSAYLHFFSLLWGQARSLPWRLAVSIPGSFFIAGTFLSLPWVLLRLVGLALPAAWLPFALALLGVVQSLWTRPQVVDIAVPPPASAHDPAIPRPADALPPSAAAAATRPLRIIQISDPHLGPFMSEQRLRRICSDAVAQDPDLVLLTGDFLTVETQRDPGPLARALAPLQALRGRCFACRGNHDLEVPGLVAEALRQACVRLLIDEEAVLLTPAGAVQVLGIDFTFRDRERHLAAVCQRWPRRPGHLRLVLLHDPGAFRHLPPGEGDLVLSGHTHGGQVGLLSLGLAWTIVRGLTPMPDHGLWTRGSDVLYVHRGTGHYGFPLRLGVPAEESLLRVYWPGAPRAPLAPA